MDTDVEIQEVLAGFREMIGIQAQEIATLRAVISALRKQLDEKDTPLAKED